MTTANQINSMVWATEVAGIRVRIGSLRFLGWPETRRAAPMNVGAVQLPAGLPKRRRLQARRAVVTVSDHVVFVQTRSTHVGHEAQRGHPRTRFGGVAPFEAIGAAPGPDRTDQLDEQDFAGSAGNIE